MHDVMVDPGTGPVIITGEVIEVVKNLSPEKWGTLSEKELAQFIGRGIRRATEFRTREKFPKMIHLSLTPPNVEERRKKSYKKPQKIPLGLAWSLNGIVVNLRKPEPKDDRHKITRA